MGYKRSYPLTHPAGALIAEELPTGELVLTRVGGDGLHSQSPGIPPHLAERSLQISMGHVAAFAEWNNHLRQRAIAEGN